MKKLKVAILMFALSLAGALAPAAKAEPFDPQSTAPAPQDPPPAQASQAAEVDLKLERGGKVSISNRAGKITVTGWDRDRVEAKATDVEDSSPLPVVASADREPGTVSLRVGRYAPRAGDEPRAPRHASGEANLVVQVPRYANLEIVDSFGSDVSVSDVQGNVLINQGNGDVDVKRVGSLRASRQNGDISVSGVDRNCQVRNLNGDINVSDVKGRVDSSTANGDISIRNAGGDARADSATGSLDIRCVEGRADANSASGSINLVGIGGDVDANSASGEVIFRGRIQAGGRYKLKTISGEVEMSIQPDPPGFTATMSSYTGELETDFPLKVDTPSQGRVNRRVVGRYGDGQAQFVLDSFSGAVRIIKGLAAASAECR
ncbi:MAG TPA: DUF4097 family beta strand repeat-containing protein [Blastocatellia bacterium]|nr:DUF4097 family beta strand repeat-containing protein [Blastocatellia bacterium]